MLHRTIAGASLAAAAAIALAPMASADPGQGVDPYVDVSSQFGNALDLGAWTAPGSKYLVVSPLGTERIACRVSDMNGGFYNCIQRDDKNIVSGLRPINIPFRALYVNF